MIKELKTIETLKINIEKNGYYLVDSENKAFSPIEGIKQVDQRLATMIECDQIFNGKITAKYAVLSNDNDYFNFSLYHDHEDAFKNCESLNCRIKGVYKVLGIKKQLYDHNTFKLHLGGLNSNSLDYHLLSIPANFINFDVI